MQRAYTATIAMGMSGSFFWEPHFVELGRLFYGLVRPPLQLDTQRKKREDGQLKFFIYFILFWLKRF